MKLLSLITSNFRALDELEVSFDPVYSAISGTNNCGKSSIINALRLLIGEEDPDHGPSVEASVKTDYSNWKLDGAHHPADAEIIVTGRFSCDAKTDASLVAFMAALLQLPEEAFTDFSIRLKVILEGKEQVSILVAGQEVTGQAAAEVRNRFRQGNALIYHNSPTEAVRTRYLGGLGQLSELSKAAQEVLNDSRADITRRLRKATAAQQARLQSLIEKLSDKLTVQVELPVRFGYMPFNLALSHGNAAVSLGGWGSGTQNKTLIMLALIRAAQGEESESSTDRLTPIILIEEPESFLHPSAQSEFGTALIRLAEELRVQVIVATHSVSFLNTDRPSSNILLERSSFRGKPRGTRLVPVNDQNWMEPFANLLGYSDDAFHPWHDAMTMRGRKILLVEGETDKRYFTRLQSNDFGERALDNQVQIFSYNGAGNLKNEAILKLVIDLSARCVVTCDLDALESVQKTINLLNLEQSGRFVTVGQAEKRGCIEDYVPMIFHEDVYASNPAVVSRLMGQQTEARSAKSEMKRRLCDKFLTDGDATKDYATFLGLAKTLNKMFL